VKHTPAGKTRRTICSERTRSKMGGSLSIAPSMGGLVAGIEVASWEASVAIRKVSLFLFVAVREKKKLADNPPEL